MQQSICNDEDVELTTYADLQRSSQSCDQIIHGTGMGQIVLNDILCFLKNKYDNYHAAVIKSTILELS